MKDPLTYTPQELAYRYKFVRYHHEAPFGVISEHKDLYWGIPAEFSLQEARDTIKVSHSRLEKMRTVPVGQVRKISNTTHQHNDWGVYKIDNQVEANIVGLEQQAAVVKAQIDAVAGPLIKQHDALKKQIKAAKDARIRQKK